MKPMLASDWDDTEVKFPVLMQPKVDGVRGLNMLGGLTGRSLKKHANNYTTDYFSQPQFVGFDGELAAELETHHSLCRLTTSALNTIKGEPYVLWWLFDYVTPTTIGLPYIARFQMLRDYVAKIYQCNERLRIMPCAMAYSMEELIAINTQHIEQGFEGSIVRDPNGMHKQGRSTVREGGLLRIKRFVDMEALVVSIVEGRTNNNEATINELGMTSRSTHQANMVPNGMVGALICSDLVTGEIFTVAAGKMTHEERVLYFQRQDLIVGKIIKYQAFMHGKKHKPRFPTFQSIRAESDMS